MTDTKLSAAAEQTAVVGVATISTALEYTADPRRLRRLLEVLTGGPTPDRDARRTPDAEAD